MVSFAHLHVHSEYSLLDGACRIDDLVDRAAKLGQTSVALTDHGVMYGVVDFYWACKKKNIHPVIGCEVYLAPVSRFSRTYAKGESAYSHLILLCENQTGYQNLIHIVSLAFSEGFYIKPRIDMELLKEHSEGLICLSACLAGAIPRALVKGDMDKARRLCNDFLEIFDREHFYLEVQDHGIKEQLTVNAGLYKLSEELGISLVATNDAHYITRQDSNIQDVLMAIQMGKTIYDPSRLKFETDEFYLKSGDEMALLFSNHPEALANSVKIAERCNVEFEFGKYHLPEFDVPDGYTSLEYLKKLCADGFAKRYPNDDGTVWKRMQYEINMIANMGFVDYFLIVSDFINYAKSHGIPVGPGRGSAAGSVVSYCLFITDLDPIHYALYFERFLNPERVSMPDIDVDFCYVRRQEVIDYVTRKYGKDCVVQIVTFGTLAAKNAIRDVGRALAMPYDDVDSISKMVPEDLHMTINKALEMNPQLKELYDNSAQTRELIDTARGVEGMPRHASTHAAGVVITSAPVDTYVPLSRNEDQMVAQFNMVTLEELGLLKMDFLGLRTLTVISDAEKMIRKHTPDFSVNQLDLEDKETYDMLSKGLTKGVFQLESSGITEVVTALCPQSIEDITAVVALYRPGPMQSIPRYVECRHNPEKVSYKHPLLEPILKVTYGCMIYQEQVMQVFQSLAGYSLGKADMVRRAMGKKKMKELAKERVTFIHGDSEQGIDGAVKRGVPENVAAELFDEILDFANYAFNKAHAVCYAYISYQTAYLKCHYPQEYMASLLTSILDVPDKVTDYVRAVRDMGISILPPDINASDSGFSVSDGNMRYGLSAIKGVGRVFMNKLVEERAKNGVFTCFQDFCERMSPFDLNRRVVESFIKAGAFDSMGYKRSQLLETAGKALEMISRNVKRNVAGQLDLFSICEAKPLDSMIVFPDIPEMPKSELFAFEKESTGLYLSGHPMDEYRGLAQRIDAASISHIISDLSGGNPEAEFKDGMTVTLACIISSIQERMTKKGDIMAFVTVEDESGSIEVIVFPYALQQFSMYLVKGKAVLITWKISVRGNNGAKILLSKITPLSENAVDDILAKEPVMVNRNNSAEEFCPAHNILPLVDKQHEVRLFIRIPTLKDKRILQRLKRILNTQKGSVPVLLYAEDNKKYVCTSEDYWCQMDISLARQLMNAFGEKNVVFKPRKKQASA